VRDSFENPNLRHGHFHSACRKVGIYGLGRALKHAASIATDVLRAHGGGALEHGRVHILAEDELRDAIAVAEMHEEHAAKSRRRCEPSHEDGNAFLPRRKRANWPQEGAAKVA